MKADHTADSCQKTLKHKFTTSKYKTIYCREWKANLEIMGGGGECKSWWTELLKLNKWKHSESWEVRCLETTKIGAPGVQISLGATMNKTWSALSLALFLLSLSLCSFLSVSVSIHWALLAWQITLHLDCHSGSRQAADNHFNKEQGQINDELRLMKYATSSNDYNNRKYII